MNVKLEKFSRLDFLKLISLVDSQEIMFNWTGSWFKYPLDLLQLETHYKTTIGDTSIRKAYKAIDDNGDFVGYCELNRIDYDNMSATASRVIIDSKQRGNGLGTKMMTELIKVGFNEYKLHRIELLVFDYNHSAKRCYEKVGFKIEGYLRESRKMGDKYYSVYLMSILDSEYENNLGNIDQK